MMQVEVRDKVFFVTGGSGTLGSAIVRTARAAGARVLFTYLHNEAEAQALREKGAVGIRLDLADRVQIRTIKKELQKESGHIDVLINNAVTVCDKTIVNLSENDWDHVIEVGLSGNVLLTKNILSLLYKSEQARIINIVSPIGLHGAFGQANYAATKGGLIAFTKSLARELGRKKILVNAVNPGFMISPITRGLSQNILDQNKERSCLRIYSDPEKVAQFIVYLASDYVQQVSGQVFHFESRMY